MPTYGNLRVSVETSGLNIVGRSVLRHNSPVNFNNNTDSSGRERSFVNETNFLLPVNNKEKSNTLEKNGVYEIHCAECDAIYIEQCDRVLKHRISEHKKAILTNTANTCLLYTSIVN